MAMTNTQYLLTKIAEEAAEVAQIALKASQFGLNECYQGGPSNAERLNGELNDLLSCVGKLELETDEDYSFDVDPDAMERKSEKVDHYREYSRQLGLVE